MKIIVCVLSLILCSCTTSKKWEAAHTSPTNQPAQIFGSYSAGCLDGAKTLPQSGQGYEFVHFHRRRFYGHPTLLEFIQSFSKSLVRQNLGRVLIADLSQPRGGPMPSGHASHQIGLDADFYFRRLPIHSPPLTLNQAINIEAYSMLNTAQTEIGENWHEENVEVLKTAARHEVVERIFVHYVIKKRLCQTHTGESWLSKIRPWWGHHYHFHVRLKCPENNPHCIPQSKPSNQDGCDETLDWWFTEEARLEGRKKGPQREPQLPQQCFQVFLES